VTGALVADVVPLARDRVLFEPDGSAVPAAVVSRCAAGDLVVTLGAGDITGIGPQVLSLLGDRS
jgi:UDP-N-acetylmuramate--alanine ligase